MFIKNGLISRCAEKLQSTLESVGPVDAQQISIEVLKALPPTGLLQTSCQLKRIAIKRSKGVKMTSFSLPLATGCPRQQWEFMLEEEMLDTYLPLLLLPPQSKSLGSNCLILFLLSKPRPEESLHLCSDTSRLLHFHQGCNVLVSTEL